MPQHLSFLHDLGDCGSAMPAKKRRAVCADGGGPPAGPAKDYLAGLPDDLLAAIVARLDVKGLLTVQQCAKRLQRLAANEALWEPLFEERFGKPSAIQAAAHKLAGSWQSLYRAKALTDKEAGKWRKPCPYELQAALQGIINSSTDAATASAATTASASASATAAAAAASSSSAASSPAGAPLEADAAAAAMMVAPEELLLPPAAAAGSEDEEDEAAAAVHNGGGGAAASPGDSSLSRTDSQNSSAANNNNDEAAQTRLAVVFLVDSSGSVGDEDFTCMTDFLDTAAQAVAAAPHCKVCVVQFSNDTRVEVPLGPLDKPAFDAAIKNMVRLNGGTNIAAAVAKAGSLLKADDVFAAPDMRRVLVLLTDGRIDGYQAREAASMVARLADEQARVALWAFGVGRGVDSAELVRIIEGGGAPGGGQRGLAGRDRYMDLCVRDDAPW